MWAARVPLVRLPGERLVSTPKSIEECDKELVEYRKALRLVSSAGKVAVWEQIDRILEIRESLQKGKKRLRRVNPSAER